jgi:ArsR family transcriptional regulator
MPNQNIDQLFRAFSDRTRLRMLYLLRGREMCVGDLTTTLGLPQPTASRHLAYLRRTGLVNVRKAGLWCLYSMAKPRSPFHARLLECLGCCFDEVPELKADATRAEQVLRNGGCCPSATRKRPAPANAF